MKLLCRHFERQLLRFGRLVGGCLFIAVFTPALSSCFGARRTVICTAFSGCWASRAENSRIVFHRNIANANDLIAIHQLGVVGRDLPGGRLN